eukprot:ANDGO_01018.mRNA.1 putative formate transporter
MGGIKSPPEVWRYVQQTGFYKSRMDWKRTLILAIYAGVFVGFGALAATSVAYNMPVTRVENPGVAKAVYAAIFPIALFLIYYTSAELFTSNSMSLFAALLYYKNKRSALGLAKNWLLVLLGNLMGCLACAYVFGYLSDLFKDEPYPSVLAAAAEHKVHAGAFQVFIRAIACNWCVCLAVFGGSSADELGGRLLALWAPIFVFACIGLEHLIASFFTIPLGMMYGANVTIYQFLIEYSLPVLAGNIIGGSFFMSGVLWYLFTNAPPVRKLSHENPLPTHVAATISPSQATSMYEQTVQVMQDQTVEFRKRYLRKDGKPIEVLVHASLIRDPEGHPLKAMSQVRRVNPRTSTVDRNETPGVIVADVSSDGHARRIQFIDDNLASLLGYGPLDKDDLVGKTVQDITYSEDGAVTDHAFHHLLSNSTAGMSSVVEAARLVRDVRNSSPHSYDNEFDHLSPASTATPAHSV